VPRNGPRRASRRPAATRPGHALFFAAAAALALAGNACAEDDALDTKCDAYAELAERFMRHRQETNDLEGTWRMAAIIRNPELSSIAQALAHEAYKRPRQASDEGREQAARDFSDETRTSCLAGPDAREAR
jgi:hypothetical protein